ncbi:UvrD/REP helicase N-terminal domain [Haematococcus lacustris]|uniref:UvrD/REP helicase N-terminal domain n=1 Tax=Haematococcus lacustris TaxID=44745 RepID=A0A699YYX9_HAELA|nr:UvrD/REP helicase N-terminal domain [Haematococcus lacustris]
MDPALPLATKRDIVDDPARAKLIQAVAGSGKTEVLVQIALKAAQEGTNVLFVTKVNSVTFEIVNRLEAYLKIVGFAKSGSHHYTRLSSGAVIEAVV